MKQPLLSPDFIDAARRPAAWAGPSFQSENSEAHIVMLSFLVMVLFLAPQLLAQQPARQPQVPAQRPQVSVPQSSQRVTDPARPNPPSPGPVADTVDETPVVTHHEIRLNGKTLGYTATAAEMPIRNSNGVTEAHILSFRAAFENYIRSELGYKTDLLYGGAILPWDWGAQNRYVDVTNLFRNAFFKNPYMKVLVMAGYYDLATPYFAADYSLNHMGLHPEMHKNISWQFYHGGHMLYTDSEAHAKMKQDVTSFIRSALAE